MNAKPKIALYARVSSQEQAVEGVSIESQVAALKAYAESQGWVIADQYIEMVVTVVVPTRGPR